MTDFGASVISPLPLVIVLLTLIKQRHTRACAIVLTFSVAAQPCV